MSPRRAALLAGALAAGLAAAGGCGDRETAPPRAAEAPEPGEATDAGVPGRWRELRPERVDPALDPAQRDLVARLEAIGYAAGTRPAPGRSGVVVHDPERSFSGLNFFTSGHAPEAVLMDMDGEVLHRWRYPFLDAFPDFPERWLHEDSGFWRRAHLRPNGDVLAIFEGLGIVKIDAACERIWASPVRAHHDLEVLANGDVVVLTRRPHVVPRIHPRVPILEDYVTVLDGEDGTVRRSVSVLEALERSPFRELWRPAAGEALGEDIFHTNTVAVLEGRLAGRLPAFRRGNVLVSLLVPDLIAVLDLEARRAVWAIQGSFRKQHDPKVLDSGNLLLFDNRGAEPFSRVLELDPAAPQDPVWEYAGSPERPFYSRTCGTAQRLPNGNTLITESDGGRAFEVTPEGETVWEFYNPHRAGDEGEFIATLFELVRLPPDFEPEWAGGPCAPSPARAADAAPSRAR